MDLALQIQYGGVWPMNYVTVTLTFDDKVILLLFHITLSETFDHNVYSLNAHFRTHH
jgi:hypothetical protein